MESRGWIHPSVRKIGQQPEPQRCTRVRGTNLFQCPFCSLSKFKAAKPYKVQLHLAWHARGAVEYGGYTMYRCGFECRSKLHFHCPGCTTTIIRKEDLFRHFGICKHSRFFNTTSNNSTPTPTPPAAISTPPATDPPSTAAPPATDPPSTVAPPATDPPSTVAPPATDPTSTSAPPATDPTPTDAPPATDPTPTDAPPAHLPSVKPHTNTSFEMKLKEIRVRNIIQVNCPHCDLLLNKKNLKTHIQRKHTKREVMEMPVSSSPQSTLSESS